MHARREALEGRYESESYPRKYSRFVAVHMKKDLRNIKRHALQGVWWFGQVRSIYPEATVFHDNGRQDGNALRKQLRGLSGLVKVAARRSRARSSLRT